MAESKKTDNADVKATTNRDFYPEDAQERNFDEARRLAQENHEKDMATADQDKTRQEEAEKKDASKKVIPAQPEVSADKNPEQVQTTEPADTKEK